jgi:hypothetical protein
MQKSAPAQAIRPTQPHARQQVLLHAVVGSLVLCAVLAPAAKAQTERTAPQTEPVVQTWERIEPQTLRDFWAQVKSLVEQDKLKLDGTFDLWLEADRDEDGALHSVVLRRANASDAQWRELAQSFAFALSTGSDGLDRFDIACRPSLARHVSVNLRLDEQNIKGKVVYTVERDEQVPFSNPAAHNIHISSTAGRDKNQDVVFNHMSFGVTRQRPSTTPGLTREVGRLYMTIGMTREQAGNLLRQHLSIP